MIYTVDLDAFKPIARHVLFVEWRVSSSGLGFHFRWACPRRVCRRCKALEKNLNDSRRQEIDAKRPKRNRGVLFDRKGSKFAGQWHSVKLPLLPK